MPSGCKLDNLVTLSDENKIRDAADAVRGIAEAVPLYQDVLQPALRDEVAPTLRGMVRVALAPLNSLIWGYDRIADWLQSRLEAKLQDVPPERIVTPLPTIAGPAVENLRFAAEEPTLREMYATLLATAMDANTVHLAHPSFVEVIKQLTPDEAKIVGHFSRRARFPVVSIGAALGPGKGLLDVFRHLSLLPLEAGCINPAAGPVYLENLCRLGLATIPQGSYLRNQDLYAPLLSHRVITSSIAYIQDPEARGSAPLLIPPRVALTSSYYKAHIDKQFLDISDFGREFAEACISPSAEGRLDDIVMMSVDEWRERIERLVANAKAERPDGAAMSKEPIGDLRYRVEKAEEYALKQLEREFGVPVYRVAAAGRDRGYDAMFRLSNGEVAVELKYTENPKWHEYAAMAASTARRFSGRGRAIPLSVLLVIVTHGVTQREQDRGVALMAQDFATDNIEVKVRVFSYDALIRTFEKTA